MLFVRVWKLSDKNGMDIDIIHRRYILLFFTTEHKKSQTEKFEIFYLCGKLEL